MTSDPISNSSSTRPSTGRRALVRPRDAATLILVDRSQTRPHILMGRRNASLVFMPGKFVFPGGRLDRQDGSIAASGELTAPDTDKLLQGMGSRASLRRARALALCAIRETFEETGLRIATGATGPTIVAGHSEWTQFHQPGFMPDLRALRYFARAITPPGMVRRFDTRFFLAYRDEIPGLAQQTIIPSGELENVDWINLDETDALETARITRLMLREVRALVGDGQEPLPARLPVIQYNERNGRFVREVI